MLLAALEAHADGRLVEAAQLCASVLAEAPAHAEALLRLAHIVRHQGDADRAEALYLSAAAASAAPGEALANAAVLAHRRGDSAAALERTEAALASGFRHPALLVNYAQLLRDAVRLEAARNACTEALATADEPRALTELGVVTTLQGWPEEALPHLERAVALADVRAVVEADNLLYGLLYAGDGGREHAARFAATSRSFAARRGTPGPAAIAGASRGQRLRVGLLSPDLRRHSVAHFLLPLLASAPRERVGWIAYADVPRPDEISAQIRATVDHWRPTHGLSDVDLRALIAKDAPDVLIDLAGAFAGNRLGVFAARAARTQVAYLGFPATTGLPTMDARITDAWADPAGSTESLHTERLVRMPHGFLCYRPPAEALGWRLVSDSRPALTFGCFATLSKLSLPLLRAWGELLGRLPAARLLLKAPALSDAGTRVRLEARLHDAGLPLARVELRAGSADARAHFAAYQEVDIILDTFPYNGTTTTCEALWMGVPVLTWAGAAHVSRVGASLLRAVGLDWLCAHSAGELVGLAVALAGDANRLAALRRFLPARVQASALRDEAGQAGAFVDALVEAAGGT